jgi:hypothetical protein
VLVMKTGPSRKPPSSIHVVPVISPLPFCENHAANTGSADCFPRGKTTVTPVRTGPSPGLADASPRMIVETPTSTPRTSVIAFRGPGVPSKGTPRSRARGFICPSKDVDSARTTSVTAAVLMTPRIMAHLRSNDRISYPPLEGTTKWM